MLVTIKYYTQCHILFPECKLHPETLKLLETISYGVEYGLPVDKEILFKGLPELFGYEIRHLKAEEQHKYLRPRVNVGVINAPELAEQKLLSYGVAPSNDELLIDKINLMRLYHFDQCRDLSNYYAPYIKERAATFGHPDEESYLSDLFIMDKDKLTEVEARLVREVEELRKIDEDVRALELRRKEVPDIDLDTPPFPILDEKFREEYMRFRKYVYKFGIEDFETVRWLS